MGFALGRPVVNGLVSWLPFDERLSGFFYVFLLPGKSFLLLLNLLECVTVGPILHERRPLALRHELERGKRRICEE